MQEVSLAAADSARKGYKVFLLAPGSKVPMYGTRDARINATTDQLSIASQFCDHPKANYGVAPDDDDLIVDCDPKNYPLAQPGDAGDWVINVPDVEKNMTARHNVTMDLLRDCPQLAKSRTVKSPRGWHFYIKKPADDVIAETDPRYPGVDFISTGKHVCGPGSRDKKGGVYVLSDGQPNALRVGLANPELTAWYNTLQRKTPHVGAGVGIDIATPEAIERFRTICETYEPTVKGNVDNTFYKLAAAAHDVALPDDHTFELIRDTYVPRLAIAADIKEATIWKCIRNAEKHAKGAKGRSLPAAKFQEFAPQVNAPPMAASFLTVDQEPIPDAPSRSEMRVQMMVQRDMLLADWQWKDADKGIKENSLANMVYALRTEGGEQFRLNDFSGQVEFEGRPFWRDDVKTKNYSIQEEDEIAFKNWFSAKYAWEVRETTLWAALHTVAQLRRYHPVLDYLNSVKWDGKPRLDGILVETLGSDDTRLNREIGRRLVLSMVARIFEPGCKQDHVVMLESGQGFEKSKWVEALGGEFSATGSLEQGNKDTFICMKGNWVIELAEFDGMNTRAHFAWMKSVISNRIDNYRAVYAKTAQKVPRESVFIATINPSSTGEYLKDTENRRFWPVKVKNTNLKKLEANRDQYFAEAVQALRNGEKWWITDPDLLEDARKEQSARRERDVWFDILEPWLLNREDSGVSMVDLYAFLGLTAGHVKSTDRNRLYGVLRDSGWEPAREFGNVRWVKWFDWESLR